MIRKRAKIIEISQIESDKVQIDSNGLQIDELNSIEQFGSKEWLIHLKHNSIIYRYEHDK